MSTTEHTDAPSPTNRRPTAVTSPLQGVVASVTVAAGDVVREGQTVAWVEAMKMEHPVSATAAGTVVEVLVAVGSEVGRDAVVLRLGPLPAGPAQPAQAAAPEPGAGTGTDDAAPAARPDLEALHERLALLADAARPEAVARRHAAGRLTAREMLDRLVDDDSWVEYGGLAVAAQRAVRSEAELAERTPADGFIAGIGTVNADLVGDEAASVAVASYDYTVLAGTQGMIGHLKKDRLFDVVERLRLPVVLFAEGGGGRPSDTDYPVASWLNVEAFRLWAGLAGLVPRIGVAAGYCFAGNAGLLGCSDIVIATEGSSIGMGGPAMIAGAGLGEIHPDKVGPVELHARAGSVDVVVADDAAAVAAAAQALSYFQGRVAQFTAADQEPLRHAVPADRMRAYDLRAIVHTLADTGSVLELRPAFAPGILTALIRIGGRPIGLVANSSAELAGALTSDGADKAARFLQLCEAFGLPVVTLVDTPGIMVGPEAEGTGLVRHAARLFTAGARLSVPSVAIVLRKAYGLGAQAMCGGSTVAPTRMLAWPTAEFGAMGIEGAVSLALRKQLAAMHDPVERENVFRAAVAHLYDRGKALSVASMFEIDDVIDPADTRRHILATLRSAARTPRREVPARPWLDTW